MFHLLDRRTIALVYVAIRAGLAVVLAYLWAVQRNYPPARDWAIGSILTAAGLFLLSLRHLVSPQISEILSSALLLPGWMIFDWGIIRACGRQPPYRLWTSLCALALLGNFWFADIQPNDPIESLLYHGILILFDLGAARVCLSGDYGARRQTFRAIAVLQLISVASLAVKLAMGVFGVMAPLPQAVPKIIQLLCSATIYPMLTMLLALQTSQKLQEELNNQARRDMLTGAYNRRAFAEFIEQAWVRAQRHLQPLAVLSLDIDNFKAFNDQYGHQTGDLALMRVSTAAQATLHSADIWCRHGGEEFVALLPNTNLEQAYASAERLRQAVAQAGLQVPQGTLSLSVSIGVAEHSPRQRNWNDLLAESDAALYQAKAAGKNCTMVSGNAPLRRNRQ
jgi:diguanylate cyclase (GGDEF)-like protein